ncbi:hypothetical protein [Sphingomonas glaciei]|uniref:DUF5872 domain-containing protein n=1 Tax=Sphingomonas glaciei TaxID=2938948 RepID=A0ABY5MXP9_9SPHN|nr:hypothetical protein [Sphingomonas glaciei]UUR09230.1 hypothetical protein M1K48_06365 [Sphingomonas glaciei]
MSETAEKTDPALWEKVKKRVTAGDKGGDKGEWSARKAQLTVAEYKKAGGGYRGGKDPHNHLAEWTREEWGTKSGKQSGKTGERYLPKKAREALTDTEYKRTTAKKHADTAKGKQFSSQPTDVARKTAAARHGEPTKAELMAEARKRDIRGRSTMTKSELAKALAAS